MKIKNSIIIFAILSSLVTSTYIYAEEEKVKSADVVDKLSKDKLDEKEKEWLKEVLSKFEGIYGDGQIHVGGHFTTVIGTNNKDIEDSGSGIGVLGTNNIYNRTAYATIGYQNSNFGANAYVMGYDARTYAENSIAIGSWAKALPFIDNFKTRPAQNDDGLEGEGIAIGTKSIASGHSNALGFNSVAFSIGSVAIGKGAYAGPEEEGVYYITKLEDLQIYNSKIFGEYKADVTPEVRDNEIGEKIFEKYKGAFTKKGITTFDKFKDNFKDNWKNYLLDLGRQMAYNTEYDGAYATAIGKDSKAKVFGGVALGYESVSERVICTDDTYDIYGAVSVGNEHMKRQIINVADATEDTDAVNLRQLKKYVDETNPFTYSNKDGEKVYKDDNGYYMLNSEGKHVKVEKDNVIINAKDNIQVSNVKSSIIENKTVPAPTSTPKPNEENNIIPKDEKKDGHVVVVEDLRLLEKSINSKIEEIKANKSENNTLNNKISNNTESIVKINNSIVTINKDITQIKDEIKKIDEKSNLALDGVSNAVAMANLPQVMGNRKFNLGASYGYYGGSHALAIGISGTNNNQNFIYKLSGSVNSKGNIAFGAGIGVMFGEINNDKTSISELKEINKKQTIEIEKIKQENAEIKKMLNKLMNNK